MSIVPETSLRVYVGEHQSLDGRSVYLAILEAAVAFGLRGATVMRAVEGFGHEDAIRSERLVDVAWDLPVVVEIVDESGRIDAFLPQLDRLVPDGLVTLSPSAMLSHGGSAAE